jgi:GH15 family glucan-1,4-alpha-glucosidase
LAPAANRRRRGLVGLVLARGSNMERLVRVASLLGLYAEEYDVETSRHLGNFPQAFSHLALVEAASRIILADRLQEVFG